MLLDHNLPDFRDRAALVDRLAPTIPVALAVRDYWISADPDSPHSKLAAWRAEPESPRDKDLYRYTGPGSLFLTVRPQATCIHTGGRWRGFLSIEPLRRVHLAAFRGIAEAFGASSMALYGDSWEVDDLFCGGQSQGTCIELLERMWGPPQRTIEEVDSKVAAAAERSAPRVWFWEGTLK